MYIYNSSASDAAHFKMKADIMTLYNRADFDYVYIVSVLMFHYCQYTSIYEETSDR